MLQRVHEQRVAEHGDAVEHAARGAERAIGAGPHFERMRAGLEPRDLHVLRVARVRGAVAADRDVVAERTGGRHVPLALRRAALEIERDRARTAVAPERRRAAEARGNEPEQAQSTFAFSSANTPNTAPMPLVFGWMNGSALAASGRARKIWPVPTLPT